MTAFMSQEHRWLRSIEARIEGQVVEVAASAHGRVERIAVAEGALVERGELLVELDHRQLDSTIAAASGELAQAMDGQGRPANILERIELAPSPEVARARKRLMLARLQRVNAEVRAPVGGRVLSVKAQPREYLSLAQPLVAILDSDDVWILARFAAQDFPRLRLGLPATVSAGARLHAARISGLTSPTEPALLEFIARPIASLQPGMLAAVSVAAE